MGFRRYTTATGEWVPIHAESNLRPPPPGTLVPLQHGVWRVTHLILGDEATGLVVTEDGHADIARSFRQPYTIELAHVGGAVPDGWEQFRRRPDGPLTVRSTIADVSSFRWYAYRDRDRWPQCSCCGEPFPCRSAVQDEEVALSLDVVAVRMSRRSGQCWHCGEELRPRQMVVGYDGDNLDLPGTFGPLFHARETCAHAARKYEERWLALDPRRERILTYARCDGVLLIHADGSSECAPGRGPFGSEHESAPGCGGNATHEHRTRVKCCSAHLGWKIDAPEWSGVEGCPRGCVAAAHPAGCVPARRARRDGVRTWWPPAAGSR